MKIGIIYDSLTGNTRQIANAIYEACENEEIIAFEEVKNIENIEDIELIFVGSWTDKGMCSKKIIEFYEKIHNKKIAIFGTAGFGGSDEYFNKLADRTKAFIPKDNEIIGYFYCQGKMPMSVRGRYVKMIQENPEDKNLVVSIENFDKALSHPDKNDLENAKEFALEIIDMTK